MVKFENSVKPHHAISLNRARILQDISAIGMKVPQLRPCARSKANEHPDSIRLSIHALRMFDLEPVSNS